LSVSVYEIVHHSRLHFILFSYFSCGKWYEISIFFWSGLLYCFHIVAFTQDWHAIKTVVNSWKINFVENMKLLFSIIQHDELFISSSLKRENVNFHSNATFDILFLGYLLPFSILFYFSYIFGIEKIIEFVFFKGFWITRKKLW
jgi:hypothetical protein